MQKQRVALFFMTEAPTKDIINLEDVLIGLSKNAVDHNIAFHLSVFCKTMYAKKSVRRFGQLAAWSITVLVFTWSSLLQDFLSFPEEST